MSVGASARPGSLLERVRARREEILALAARRGATNVRVFGSVARGEEGPDSDLDLLVDMEEDRSLLDLGGLLMDLESTLNLPVQVATPEMLHWYIRDRVLVEALPL